MAGKMVCSHCESVIPADSKFCPNCGAGFEPIDPVVNQFYPPSPPPQQPQSPQTGQPPPAPQYTQVPIQQGFSTPVADPRKSKKTIYIIIAVVAVVLVCVCFLGIFVISSLSQGA